MSSALPLDATSARTGLMAAEVILQMSERVTALEQALDSSTRANEILHGQLELALQREREMEAEVSAASARLKQAQELSARLLAECETHQASAVAAVARAAVAEDRAAQAHRAADSAVEKARSEASRAAAAAGAALEEERRRRVAAEDQKAHLEGLMQRLAAVVRMLTKRCAALLDGPNGAPTATVDRHASGNASGPLLSDLQAAERELSALDERLGNPALSADEQAALRAAMLRTGSRIRKLSAARNH